MWLRTQPQGPATQRQKVAAVAAAKAAQRSQSVRVVAACR